MRPRSIRLFEAFWFASILVAVIGGGLGIYMASQAIDSLSGAEGVPEGVTGAILAFGAGFGLLFVIGIPILLWFLAVRQRLEPVKWVILAVVILSTMQSITGFVMAMVVPQPVGMEGQVYVLIIDLLSEALGIAAVIFLLQNDSTAWFRSSQRGNPRDIFR